MKLKTFDLEKAKAGAPVCTRDGRDVRIVCWDRKNSGNNYPIVGLIESEMQEEYVQCYTKQGIVSKELANSRDLFMKPIKRKAWVLTHNGKPNEYKAIRTIYYDESVRDERIKKLEEQRIEIQIHEIEIEE